MCPTCSDGCVEPHATLTPAAFVNAGPLTVPGQRGIRHARRSRRRTLPRGPEWTITMTPIIFTAVTGAWMLHRSVRDERTGWAPAAWCARCDMARCPQTTARPLVIHSGYLRPGAASDRWTPPPAPAAPRPQTATGREHPSTVYDARVEVAVVSGNNTRVNIMRCHLLEEVVVGVLALGMTGVALHKGDARFPSMNVE